MAQPELKQCLTGIQQQQRQAPLEGTLHLRGQDEAVVAIPFAT